MPTINHHILAKEVTEAIWDNFKNGVWTYPGGHGKGFVRTGVSADFPSPDAAFYDTITKNTACFEFKPDTESKRGILTGVGQAIGYLNNCQLSYLVVPETLSGFDLKTYMKEFFTNLLSTNSVGLITYENNNPRNIDLVFNVPTLCKTPKQTGKNSVSRYWAKHIDAPLPLIHLLLHYYYQRKVGITTGDPFEDCYRERLLPFNVFSSLYPEPIYDVFGNPIQTMSGRGNKYHFSTNLKKARALTGSAQSAEIARLKDIWSPKNKTGSSEYRSLYLNYVMILKHLHYLDSNNELTDEGFALYNAGLTHGPTSNIFRDYFAKDLLTTGHHLDLILDYDEVRRNNPGKTFQECLSIMESNYMSKGYIKRNNGRLKNPQTTKAFLHYERTLWKHLGIMDESSNIQWRRITNIFSIS